MSQTDGTSQPTLATDDLLTNAYSLGGQLRAGIPSILARRQQAAALSEMDLAIVGQAAEADVSDALGWLHRVTLGQPPKGWERFVVQARDAAESLVVVLGVAAMDGPHGEIASMHERRVLDAIHGLDRVLFFLACQVLPEN